MLQIIPRPSLTVCNLAVSSKCGRQYQLRDGLLDTSARRPRARPVAWPPSRGGARVSPGAGGLTCSRSRRPGAAHPYFVVLEARIGSRSPLVTRGPPA